MKPRGTPETNTHVILLSLSKTRSLKPLIMTGREAVVVKSPRPQRPFIMTGREAVVVKPPRPLEAFNYDWS